LFVTESKGTVQEKAGGRFICLLGKQGDGSESRGTVQKAGGRFRKQGDGSESRGTVQKAGGRFICLLSRRHSQ